MEYFDISLTNNGLHIEGFPNAIKVIALKGLKAQRLAELASHKLDLESAIEYLEALKTIPAEQNIIQRSLYLSAISCLFKCFQKSKARRPLIAADIYTEGIQIEVYNHFRALRDKHLLHDENAYHQSLPGAILNDGKAEIKIAKIVCLQATAVNSIEDDYNNLYLLCVTARNWVISQFDILADELTAELEAMSYTELFKMDSPMYCKPSVEDIHINRELPTK